MSREATLPRLRTRRAELIDQRIAERDLAEADDMVWAKPYVDEGLAALERGEVITLEEHQARNARRLAALMR